MSACLGHLPNELLLQILEYISISSCATTALASLCLTSRLLRNLAEPYLYASHSNKKLVDKPHLFPLSLIERPALADHVRHIEMWASDGDCKPMSEDDLRRLRKAVDELNLPWSLAAQYKEGLWFLGVTRATYCRELSLVLASHNLETLSLHGSICGSERYRIISHILFDEPNWSGKFDKVTSVCISSASLFDRTRLYELAFVFKMPSIRRFEIQNCHERCLGRSQGWNSAAQLDTDLGQWLFVRDSSVETIIFRESVIGSYVVNALLHCCKAVKQLYIGLTAIDHFYFFRLEDALCRHAGSLEHLAIFQDGQDLPYLPHQAAREADFAASGELLFLPVLAQLRSAVVPLVAIPVFAVDPIGILIQRESNPTFLDAEIRKHLPPSPQPISICGKNLHYGNTKDPLGFT